MKFVFGTMIAVGFIFVLGVAGSDCDGKCMENAMSMGDTIIYSLVGIGLMLGGIFGIKSLGGFDID